MLIDRVRPPETDGIIYHYCSGETLVNILRNKTIRFSDINVLNDAEEGKWGYGIFIEAINKILKRTNIPPNYPKIERKFFDEIDKIWATSAVRLASFVSCFSSDGDSLSQWRAYADDGRGFAIGFRATELRRLPIQMLDVLYDREQQIQEMILAIGVLHMQFEEEQKNFSDAWFFDECALLAASAIALKNPAWRDEKEVRCQHVVNIEIDDFCWKLVDIGGVSDGKNVPGQPIHFQVRGGTIMPFIDMPFEVSENRSPVEKIVFGPKCPNTYGNLLFLLGNLGYGKIGLETAGGAYR